MANAEAEAVQSVGVDPMLEPRNAALEEQVAELTSAVKFLVGQLPSQQAPPILAKIVGPLANGWPAPDASSLVVAALGIAPGTTPTAEPSLGPVATTVPSHTSHLRPSRTWKKQQQMLLDWVPPTSKSKHRSQTMQSFMPSLMHSSWRPL